MTLSVIISTYNSPDWLEKCLWAWAHQSDREFELIIADDGSTDETRRRLETLRDSLNLPLRHVWHEDRGFRKCEILNQAIVASEGDYLIISDGDCLPRRDFVATHRRLARPGRFLSGGYVKLPLQISQELTLEDIVAGRFADPSWLRQRGMPVSRKLVRLCAKIWPALLDHLTSTKPTWNGHNSSGWKADLVAVNGFNEDMQYGGLDRELGERLENADVHGVSVRHRAICCHLDHRRAYATQENWVRNVEIRRRVRAERIKWTENGIVKKTAE